MTDNWDYFRNTKIVTSFSQPEQEDDDAIVKWKKRAAAYTRRRELVQNSIAVFIREATEFDANGTISSQELYAIYRKWCQQEQAAAETMRTLCYRLKHCSYPVKATVLYIDGKQCRGFRGIRIKAHDT